MPRLPQLHVLAPDASSLEAAAVVAALERFLRDQTPAPAPPAGPDPWQQAALREGVLRQPGPPPPWA